jgi:radical SAM superfamily enzyme YgiQ (UPF0313 family)
MGSDPDLDLLLVFPNNRQRAYGALATDAAAISAPLQLGLTAAYVRRSGYSVRVLDADAENLTASETAARVAEARPRLLLLSTDSLNSGDVTKMAAASDVLCELREVAPATPTILEGVVPSAFPEQMLREERATFVCQGEAFEPVVDLLRVLKSGRPHPEELVPGLWWLDDDRPVHGPRRPLQAHPDDLPLVAWDLLPVEKYRAHYWHCFDRLDRRRPYASIYTNLGCPYACTFCNVNVIAGKPNFRPRTPENVLLEIDLLVRTYGVHNIRIVDNVFTVRLDLVEKLCDLIIARGYDLNFWCYARVETIKDPSLLRKMKKAGIHWVAFGIEAASERVRRAVDKPSSTESIDHAIERTREAGINIGANFIFGLPEDDLVSMQATLEMAKNYNFEFANFYAAMAYPGTELHDQARREGIRIPTAWSGFGQYSEDALPMSTRHVSSGEVLRFRDRAFVEYNTAPRYRELVRRKFGPPADQFLDKLMEIKLRRRLLQTE